MSRPAGEERRFTGRHMLVIMLAFFGVIIAVNVVMMTFALRSWTGLVVPNTYVASQQFNQRSQEGRAQAALGWRGELAIREGRISYALVSAGQAPVPLDGVTATLRRPVGEEVLTVELEPAGAGVFEAALAPADGLWIVEIEAQAGLERPFTDIRRVQVRAGAVR